MIRLTSIYLGVSIIAFATHSLATTQSGDDYRCTIDRFSQAQGDVGPTYESLKVVYLGKQFTVDRASGITAGALKNSIGSTPSVVDHGGQENSYKVVSAIGAEPGLPGTQVTALNIMEFVAGEKKPFNYMINDSVFFGTCEPF